VGRECVSHATSSLKASETQAGYEALGDCFRFTGEGGLAFHAYLSSLFLSLKWGGARRRPLGAANLLVHKIVGSVFGDAARLLAIATAVVAKRVLIAAVVAGEAGSLLGGMVLREAVVWGKRIWREGRKQATRFAEEGFKAAEDLGRSLWKEMLEAKKAWEEARSTGGFEDPYRRRRSSSSSSSGDRNRRGRGGEKGKQLRKEEGGGEARGRLREEVQGSRQLRRTQGVWGEGRHGPRGLQAEGHSQGVSQAVLGAPPRQGDEAGRVCRVRERQLHRPSGRLREGKVAVLAEESVPSSQLDRPSGSL